MIRHNIDFCKNKLRFLPLHIFPLYGILMLMKEINIKQLSVHMWKIRAEYYSILMMTSPLSPKI